MARNKLQGLRPTPGESSENYIMRGAILDPNEALEFRPQEGDSLGEYLLRLRVANGLSPEAIEETLSGFSQDTAVTRVELARLESGALESVNEERLRVLATLYGVSHEWVLQVAQYHVQHYTPSLPASDNAFAMLTARAMPLDSLNPEAQQTLQEIFNEIIAAVQVPSSDSPREI